MRKCDYTASFTVKLQHLFNICGLFVKWTSSHITLLTLLHSNRFVYTPQPHKAYHYITHIRTFQDKNLCASHFPVNILSLLQKRPFHSRAALFMLHYLDAANLSEHLSQVMNENNQGKWRAPSFYRSLTHQTGIIGSSGSADPWRFSKQSLKHINRRRASPPRPVLEQPIAAEFLALGGGGAYMYMHIAHTHSTGLRCFHDLGPHFTFVRDSSTSLPDYLL